MSKDVKDSLLHRRVEVRWGEHWRPGIVIQATRGLVCVKTDAGPRRWLNRWGDSYRMIEPSAQPTGETPPTRGDRGEGAK